MNDNKSKGLEAESGGNTEQNRKIFLYLTYAVGFLIFVSIIVFICMFNSIKLSIAIIRTACVAIKDMPLMFLIPPIFTIILAVYWIWWMI